MQQNDSLSLQLETKNQVLHNGINTICHEYDVFQAYTGLQNDLT